MMYIPTCTSTLFLRLLMIGEYLSLAQGLLKMLVAHLKFFIKIDDNVYPMKVF